MRVAAFAGYLVRSLKVVPRASKVAVAIWLLMTFLPSAAMLSDHSSRNSRLVARSIGDVAAPYLGAAPASLLIYLISGSFVMPVIFFLMLDADRNALVATPLSMLRQGSIVVAKWAALYTLGMLVLWAALAVLSGEPAAQWSWAFRLMLLGAVAELPAAGVVLVFCTLTNRRWLAAVLASVAMAGIATWGAVARLQKLDAWAPAILRAKLLSGRSTLLQSALVCILGWVIVALLVAMAVVHLRHRRGIQRSTEAPQPTT